jgi:hypothetical protein
MTTPRPVAAACPWLPDYLLLFRFAPIFLRGMQSFRRYYNSNYTMTLQLKQGFLFMSHNAQAAMFVYVMLTTGVPTAN